MESGEIQVSSRQNQNQRPTPARDGRSDFGAEVLNRVEVEAPPAQTGESNRPSSLHHQTQLTIGQGDPGLYRGLRHLKV